jgi:hypothetical protein
LSDPAIRLWVQFNAPAQLPLMGQCAIMCAGRI